MKENLSMSNLRGRAEKQDKEVLEILRPEEIIKVEAKGEKRENSLPMVYIPGWGETSKSTKPFLEVLAQDNDVISFDQPREMRLGKELAVTETENNFSMLQLQAAFAIIETIKKSGYDKVDAVGSSQGGMILTVAAYLAPKMFRGITLVEPAGIIGDDSIFKLVKRFRINNGKQNANRPKEQREQCVIATDDFNKFWQKNLIQSFKEIKEMSKADITNMLAELYEKGIGISIVSHVDSKVFESDKIQKEISRKLVDRSNEENKLLFDGVYTIMSKRKNEEGESERYEGGHSDIKYDKNFQKQLLTIVRTLADKKAKEKISK